MKLLKQLIERDQWAELITAAENISQLSHKNTIEVLAFSEKEAMKKAIEILHVEKSGIEYSIITKGMSGFFGWLRTPSRYRCSLKPEILEQIQENIDYNKYNKLAEEKNGSFRLQMRKSGLTLTVFPPEGIGRPVSFADIEEEITKLEYQNVNFDICHLALKNLEQKYTIAPYTKSEFDATFSISVADDSMSASLIISKTHSQGCIPDVSDIIGALKQLDVVHGIKEEYIEEMLDNEILEIPVIIAEGTKLEPGKDAYIDYYFSTGQEESIKHAVRQDGSIDFKELNIIQNVHEGDILAEMHPHTQGIHGRTVTNKIIHAIPGKPTEWNLGQNVTLSQDKRYAIAVSSGQVYIKDKKLCVDPALEINSNVDLTIGNIDFLGNVIIKGNIADGFSVISGGNIEIHGHVGKCFIQAAGNIIAHQGIQGKDENRIECNGNLYARFIERSNIMVGGNIIITKSLLHSNVVCEKNIYVFGDKKAIIAGGNIKAQEEIVCRQFGAESYIETHLEVGHSQHLLSEVAALENLSAEKTKKINAMKDEFAQIAGNIALEQSIKLEHMILNQVNSQKLTEQNLISKRQDLHKLQKRSSISAEHAFLPGVKIKIGNAFTEILLDQGTGTLKLKDHDIVFGPYQPSEFFKEISSQQVSIQNSNKKTRFAQKR